MPTLEETVSELRSAYVQRFETFEQLPDRYRSKWDIIAESTKYKSPSRFQDRLSELLKAIREVVIATHLVDEHLEEREDDEVLIQRLKKFPTRSSAECCRSATRP